MDSLSNKKCVPCEIGTPPLKPEEYGKFLKELKLPWEVSSNRTIKHEFKFKDFKEAMQFVNRVAEIAEEEGHHPDMYIYYNKVVISLTTHHIRGLSENDFILAAKIEELL